MNTMPIVANIFTPIFSCFLTTEKRTGETHDDMMEKTETIEKPVVNGDFYVEREERHFVKSFPSDTSAVTEVPLEGSSGVAVTTCC